MRTACWKRWRESPNGWDRPVPGLYADRIRELARRGREGRGLERHDASAYRKNPMCGDEVTVFLRRGADGPVEVGYRSRGCLLCLAACERMALIAQGLQDSDRLADLVSAVRTMFDGAIPPEMEEFAPVCGHPSRRGCVLLPFEALAELLGERP